MFLILDGLKELADQEQSTRAPNDVFWYGFACCSKFTVIHSPWSPTTAAFRDKPITQSSLPTSTRPLSFGSLWISLDLFGSGENPSFPSNTVRLHEFARVPQDLLRLMEAAKPYLKGARQDDEDGGLGGP